MADEQRTVIRGGEVLDGTGGEARRADVLIAGERIAAVGNLAPQPGDRTVDATGLFVTPGFINIHRHSDLTALTAPQAHNRVFEGVTTEVSGQCGHTIFPVAGAVAEHVASDLAQHGLALDWTDFAGFAAQLESGGSSINHAFMVGHGTLRAAALGLEDRPPSASEMETMRALLREALDQGVFGLSSGLIYPPGCYAAEDELADLAAVCAAARPPAVYASHQRSEGDRLEASVDEFLNVLRHSGVRGQLSHVKITGPQNWHKLPWLHDRLQGARDQGLPVTGDRYPYTASSTGLSRDLPAWVHAGGPEAFLKRLADAPTRRRIAAEMRIDNPQDYWHRIAVVWSKSDAHAPYLGRRVDEIAAQRGGEPLDVVMDLLLEAEGSITAIYHRMSEENLQAILRWPFIVIGSDSRARSDIGQPARGLPHPRNYGTHARVLGRYVRQLQVLTWPEAVYKMTGAVADILGLADRGTLVPGAAADVAVFDPQTIIDRATYEDPRQASEGMVHVFVNGQAVLENGRHTGRRPGRVLRRVEHP